jgi:hypothetical protein
VTAEQFYKGYRIAAVLYPTPVNRWIPHGALFKKRPDGSERELRVSGSVAIAFEDKAEAEEFALQMCRSGIDRMRP